MKQKKVKVGRCWLWCGVWVCGVWKWWVNVGGGVWFDEEKGLYWKEREGVYGWVVVGKVVSLEGLKARKKKVPAPAPVSPWLTWSGDINVKAYI
jgi:hypothetical protein